jgi:raffinose/stachyose/melibiose transport system permease protein
MDGANDRQLMWHVLIPQLRGTILVCALLSILGSLKYFDLVYMLVGGAPAESREVLATHIFRLAFESGQGRFGYASSVAVVFLTLTVLVAAIANWIKRRASE